MTTFNQKFNELVKVILSEKQQVQDETDYSENILDMDISAKSQDFFQDNIRLLV